MAITDVRKDFENLSIVIVIELEAPIERAWDLWADPRQLERWWGPPTYPATFDRHDFRPGGSVGYYMTSPEGDTHRGWWQLVEVKPHTEIRFSDGFADDEGNPVDTMPVSTTQVKLEEDGGRTRMVITSRFETLEDMERLVEMGVVEGMSAAMGQMEDVLATAGDIVVSRSFDAPREELFAAWTEPERFARWFGGEAIEVPLETVDMDVREGGDWRATMRRPGGGEIAWHGTYTEVRPPERLALTMNDEPGDPDGDPITVDFAEVDGASRMTLVQPRADFSDEQVDQTLAGYRDFFEAMRAVVAGR